MSMCDEGLKRFCHLRADGRVRERLKRIRYLRADVKFNGQTAREGLAKAHPNQNDLGTSKKTKKNQFGHAS